MGSRRLGLHEHQILLQQQAGQLQRRALAPLAHVESLHERASSITNVHIHPLRGDIVAEAFRVV